jgi:hypothetical protein
MYIDMEKIGVTRKCLLVPEKLYNISKRLNTREVEEYFTGFTGFTDCTEQEILRPKNKFRMKLYSSGKKKKHTTAKNMYTENQKG